MSFVGLVHLRVEFGWWCGFVLYYAMESVVGEFGCLWLVCCVLYALTVIVVGYWGIGYVRCCMVLLDFVGL